MGKSPVNRSPCSDFRGAPPLFAEGSRPEESACGRSLPIQDEGKGPCVRCKSPACRKAPAAT